MPDSALYYAELQFDFASEKKLKKYMASALSAKAYIHYLKSSYASSLKLYIESLKRYEEIADKNGIADVQIGIGNIYVQQHNTKKAMEYYSKNLKYYVDNNDKNGIARMYNNLGRVYSEEHDYDKAIEYYNQCLSIRNELNDKSGAARALGNIAYTHNFKNEFEKAVEFFLRCIEIFEELGDKEGLANAYSGIAHAYLRLEKFKESITFASKSLQIAKEHEIIYEEVNASRTLYQAYKKQGKIKEAMKMLELSTRLKEQQLEKNNLDELLKLQFKYDFEKKTHADSIKTSEAIKVTEARLQTQREQLAKERTQRIMLYGSILFLLVFAGFIYNRFKISQQQQNTIQLQKNHLESQHKIVEQKNREITDSINYAKRIQTAILPPQKTVLEYLKNSFILYLPKDIVAGDFYWIEPTQNSILFAVADCTGHGVPGAMVSVICHNALNRAVREYRLTKPGRILDKTREIIIQEFEKSDDEVKDGMDIALCAISNNELLYAGANNPLWIIRNNELIEICADKQPIGKFDKLQPYHTHVVQLQKDDTLYIFSDGFADQFGGKKGKKFKTPKLRELLLSVQDKSIPQQKEILIQTLENWKGNIEQVDDICVIGIKI
ncbi:MAG: tetratricopeptide repeat protein [Bacteroidetes bacterium]|nr:tetratricopeptide repeat protein [Bacteroidota bacterium]MBV6460250.1 hypothetical protein [Flavobacteriales bacterium]WKZ74618.1 MAG: tetratricopeptide repeat protein [Vicingaceae bacterium]MCL4816838.1 tetratricopeptide repeat protein [Flavobacteriales bacterium]NOG94925.1 tetratricopeptide repeat protein [Bacteroidota bacterium]